jgi:L-histidine Nalpha-methyltransferase
MTAAPRIVNRLGVDAAADRAALIAGLRAIPASIPPKYFYDAAGCELFAAICDLPEYYPTRTERAIFAEHRDDIARVIGAGTTFVDLGAGDCRKAASWFDALHPSRYVAVDFAAAAITAALSQLAPLYPSIAMSGIVADFTQGLDLDADLGAGAVTFFYPGSSIGNFSHAAALALLASLAGHCTARPGSGLLIGVDMKKDPRRLVAAYDDAQGITAAFNRNVLNPVNRIADADFVPAQFLHRASYDADAGRVQMHLESACAQIVTIDGAARPFAAGERIHTEDSYKYAADEFAAMLRRAGFTEVSRWLDPARDFGVYHAR